MSTTRDFNQDFTLDDEEQSPANYTGRDACVVVIDASASMFETFNEDDESTSLFTKTLSVLERMLLNKIISSNKDLFGVILYNTEHSPDPTGEMAMESPLVVPKNCAILVPMKQVEANVIRYIKNLNSSEDFMDFDNKFGHSTDGKIADVLWLCSTMFAGCGKQIRVPQVMWFTNDDLPHREGSSDHQQAFQKAKDLQQFQLDLQFYPMKADFDGDLFYKELLCQIIGMDLEDYEFPKAQLDEKLLLRRMFRRGYNRRALCHMTVEISEYAQFGASVFNFTRKAVVPKAIHCTRDRNQPIISTRQHRFAHLPEENDDDLSAELQLDFTEKLEPNQTIKYQQVGGEKICFTVLEAYEIKQVMRPKIKVLGFKPVSILSDHNFVKAPYFLYPSDSKVKNSTVFFRALWERCLADDKVAICIFAMRLKSYPRLVALVPQKQTVNDEGEVLRYDGFLMQFIPFAGDVRDLSELFVNAPEVEKEIAAPMNKAWNKVVSKLNVNYVPTMFENPVVTKIYQKIEEKLFGDDIDDELNKDTTLPNLDSQDSRIDPFVNSLEELLNGLNEVVVSKRKSADENGASKRKKVSPDDIDSDYVIKMCKDGKAAKLTVPVLKTFLELKNVHGLTKLKKEQLIDLVLSQID